MNRQTALRWTGYVAFAIVFAIACAYLSNWQFVRNDDRSAQLDLVARNYDAPAVPLDEAIPAGGDLDPDDEWQPVMLEGEYLADQQVLVRNRPHGGTSAFEVLVPFRTADGRTVVVNRGWVPPGDSGPRPDEVPAPPSGRVEVVARLKAAEAAPTSGRSAPEGQVPTISLDLISSEAGLDDSLVMSAYGLLVSEDPAPAARPTEIAPPSEDPGPHLSYAIQWILFAIMGFVFIWYMIRTERRHRREEAEEAADAADAAPPASVGAGAPEAPRAPATPIVPASLRRRTPQRRDRDMQDEDAILDTSDR